MVSTLLFAGLALADLPDGVLHFPLTGAPLTQRMETMQKSLQKRDAVNVGLADKTNMFSTTLQIGSNNQSVQVLVDTGSSDLWVMARSNPLCASVTSDDAKADAASSRTDGKIVCKADAMFNSSASSSFSDNSTDFSVVYGDYTFANGTYAQDDISYGGKVISKANFAVADSSNSSTPVWGIGLTYLEATVTTMNLDGTYGPTYANLPLQMKQQGIIGHNAYSLWLNDVNSDNGELLFGGIDHAKYQGSLQTVPLISTYEGGKPTTLSVMLNGISVYQGSNNAQVVSCATPALLDSGTTFMMLPTDFIDAIMQSIGGVYTRSGYAASCGISGGLTFDFSGIEINVPFSEFSFPAGRGNVCILGFLPSDSQVILGDTFLRSAYVVFDLENFEVSLANTNYNVTSSQIEAISSTVPSASQAASYSSTQIQNVYSTSVATFVQTTAAVGNSITTSSFPTTATSSKASRTLAGSASGTSTTASATHKKNSANKVAPAALLGLALLV